MGKKRKVAILLGSDITSEHQAWGGVVTVGAFLYQLLRSSAYYTPYFISTATSFQDKNSVRLLAPSTWRKGIQLVEGECKWMNGSYTHAGAIFCELEFQRYMPRRTLTQLLNEYDLIQVVAGGPAVAYIARDVSKPVTLFIATLARLERKPTAQNIPLRRAIYSHIMQPIVSNIEKRALRKVAHVFAETEYTKQAVLPYVEKSRISTDTIGINIEQFQPVSEISRTDDYVLSVGRFSDARKNIGLLFQAYALLRTWDPDAPKLLLAGANAPTPSSWGLARQLGLTDYIEYRPNISLNELIKLYQNAMFFTLSSDEEGLGIVLLEAMACATPVVSTRCGGPNSVVSNEVGFLTPVGNAEALAKRMLWILQHPEERRRMGQAGRRMVERRFSNKVVGQKYLDIYDSLLKETVNAKS